MNKRGPTRRPCRGRYRRRSSRHDRGDEGGQGQRMQECRDEGAGCAANADTGYRMRMQWIIIGPETKIEKRVESGDRGYRGIE